MARAPRSPKWSALPLVPESPDLDDVRRAAAGCRACPLWQDNSGTVFGEGPLHARLVLVGEEPGNDEDVQQRGEVFALASSPAPIALATWHPSAVLRQRAVDPERARQTRQELVDDLQTAAAAAGVELRSWRPPA